MIQLKVDLVGVEVQMEVIGCSYCGLVEGLVDVLCVWVSLKGEFCMVQIMIQLVQNNLLKFVLNVDEVMLFLLCCDNQVFMVLDCVVVDSFEDFKVYQLVVMVGVQVVICYLLVCFELVVLEVCFGKLVGFFGLLLGVCQVQNWDSFIELYVKILCEVEDDFQEFFGCEFSCVYEEYSV